MILVLFYLILIDLDHWDIAALMFDGKIVKAPVDNPQG